MGGRSVNMSPSKYGWLILALRTRWWVDRVSFGKWQVGPTFPPPRAVRLAYLSRKASCFDHGMDGSAWFFFGTQPATTQIEDLLAEKSECVKRTHRVLVTANRRTSKIFRSDDDHRCRQWSSRTGPHYQGGGGLRVSLEIVSVRTDRGLKETSPWFWLVVWNFFPIFPLGMVIPTHIFQRGGNMLKPLTSIGRIWSDVTFQTR